MVFVSLGVQDVDSAYLVKADLEDKVGALTDEINFLRNVYDEVWKLPPALKQYFPTFPLVSSYSTVELLRSHFPLVHCSVSVS